MKALSSCFSISLGVTLFLLEFYSTEGIDNCRVLRFDPLLSGKRLDNHVIENKRAGSEDFCQALCYREKKCRSINYKQTKDNDGTHLCELNKSTKDQHPDDLKNHLEFSYHGTKDPCTSNPCTGGKTCITGFGPDGYHCACPTGYTGDRCEKVESCNDIASKGAQHDGSYDLAVNDATFQVYCDMSDDKKGWTLIARFSNNDAKNWMKNSGEYWYDRNFSFGQTTNPADNTDMISPAFWSVNGTEFKITRSDDSTHTALLHTTGECLGGQTFRSKLTSYGDFRNSTVWAEDKCLGNCTLHYGGQYIHTEGFRAAECDGDIQQKDQIGFWCDYNSNGAVLTIGGAGQNCYKAAHGIGITEADEASFAHDQHGDVLSVENEYDFGNTAWKYNVVSSYSLNLWVR